MISLGFYGEVHVAGLTLTQAKVKILQHLRRYLTDEMLGLYEVQVEEEEEKPVDAKPTQPVRPHAGDTQGEGSLRTSIRTKKPKAEVSKPRTVPSGYKIRSIRQGQGSSLALRPLSRRMRESGCWDAFRSKRQRRPRSHDRPSRFRSKPGGR